MSIKSHILLRYASGQGLLLVVPSVLTLLMAQVVLAEPPPAPLTAGMTVGEVVRLWGSPTEKAEREVLRQEEWRYGNAAILFVEGKLVLRPGISAGEFGTNSISMRANNTGAATKPLNLNVSEGTIVSGNSMRRAPLNSKKPQTREILNELMVNFPDTGTSSSSSSNSTYKNIQSMYPVPGQPPSQNQMNMLHSGMGGRGVPEPGTGGDFDDSLYAE